jgi:hypothetical protein
MARFGTRMGTRMVLVEVRARTARILLEWMCGSPHSVLLVASTSCSVRVWSWRDSG